MGLPTADQIDQMFERIEEESRGKKDFNLGTSDKAVKMIRKGAGTALPMAVQTAAQGLVTSTVAVKTAAVQVISIAPAVAIAPVGMALAPWIGAGKIAWSVKDIFGLYDILDCAKGNRSTFKCRCNKCTEIIGYIIDKKERNQAVTALSVFSAGVAKLIAVGWSISKKAYYAVGSQSSAKKGPYSAQLIQSARVHHCQTAVATIMYLCGKWDGSTKDVQEATVEFLTCIMSSDGADVLKGKW